MSIEEACAVLALTPARIETLRYVLDHEQVTAKDVMAATGLSRNATGNNLAALTQAGLLHERRATHPRGSGPIIYWSADRDVIHAARDVVFDHLS